MQYFFSKEIPNHHDLTHERDKKNDTSHSQNQQCMTHHKHLIKINFEKLIDNSTYSNRETRSYDKELLSLNNYNEDAIKEKVV